MISIVCVYNDESVIENWLLKSLKDQTVEFELIKIDNTKNKFKSAAKALNYGGKKAKGSLVERLKSLLPDPILPNLGLKLMSGT